MEIEAKDALAYCRFCKSKKIRRVFKKQALHIFKCLTCKTVFLGNKIDNESIKDFYNYYGHNAFSNHLSLVTKLRYENILDSLEKYRKNNTIIDVGCGAGYFLACAAKRGWRADGSEISDGAIQLAREKGQSVIKGDIADIDFEKDKYDVATLFELIEHAADPEGIIRKLSYALRRGGAIYITTPNYNSLTRKILRERWGMFNKEHLFYFMPQGLAAVLKRYNFRIMKIKTENLSLREILKVFKKSDFPDEFKIYERQEYVRHLTERGKPLFAMKKIINFCLNAHKVGETIYIFAEKS